MSQRYIVLRMASTRDLQDERWGTSALSARPRYYSTPADFRGLDQQQPSQVQPQSATSPSSPSLRLSVSSNRVPNLRRAASAAVRSTGDIVSLPAAYGAGVPHSLRYHDHEAARSTNDVRSGGGVSDRESATSAVGRKRSFRKASSNVLRRDRELLDAVQDTEETVSSVDDLEDVAEEELFDGECDFDEENEDDRLLIAWQRARQQSTATTVQEGTAAYLDDIDAQAQAAVEDEGKYRLSKEAMFFVAAFIVLLTSGGLILGFGPIYSALVREGQWSELCTDSITDDSQLCPSQEIHLQYVFSTSFLCLSAANAFFGVFLDFFGPRLTAILGLVLSAAGNFAMAYGDSHTGYGSWLIIGYALIGAGGTGSYLAAFQLLQLYRVQGFVCSTLSSLFNCSGYIYMALEIDFVTRSVFFRVYGVLVVVCIAVCFLLFPTNCITRPGDSLAVPGFRIEKPRIKTPIGLVSGMKTQLRRVDLWYFAVFFGWISLIFAFAGGAIPSMLVDMAGDDANSASLYTSILYPVIVNGTFVYSPLVGYVIDRYGFKAIFFACLALVQLFITLLLVPSLKVQILTFFVYSMAQACLYALQFAYIMMCFPAELNGTLQAFMATVSFSFGLLNYLLNPWAQIYLDGDYTVVLMVLAVPTLFLYVFIDVVQGCEDQIVHDSDPEDDNLQAMSEMSKLI